MVAHLFDERNGAVEKMVAMAIDAAIRSGKKIGICGQAPSDYPEFAEFLVKRGHKFDIAKSGHGHPNHASHTRNRKSDRGRNCVCR